MRIFIESLPHGRMVNDLAFDVYGRLWAATDSLAWRFDGVAWRPAGVAAAALPQRPPTWPRPPRGGMWIGSDGQGLLLYKQGAFARQFGLAVKMRAAKSSISLQVQSGSVKLGVYSTAGTPVLPTAAYGTGAHRLGLSGLPRGLYLARATRQGATRILPVVVE